MRRGGMLLLVFAAVVFNCGCEMRDPLSLLGACLGPRIEQLHRDGESISVTCDLLDTIKLIGLPERDVTSAEMTRAGLSNATADLLERSSLRGPRWCAIAEDADSPPTKPQPGDISNRRRDGRCVESRVDILNLTVTESTRIVRVVVERSNGRPRLSSITPVR